MEVTAANLAQWNASQLRLDLPDGDDRTRLTAVAKEFESLFAKQMLDSMRDTLNPEADMLNGGMAQDIFDDMLYDEYARMIAESGTLGIADMIVQQYEGQVTVQGASPSRVAALYDSVQARPI